ncbi:MAG: guanylate kinase [Alphaproteobacteria bacterium]|nr:guanylate kinase [Alphaproteobacteria bacterium]
MTPIDRGLVLVISGPSGVGKSTLIAHLRGEVPDLGFSISSTTRAPRPGERDGVDYHFVDEARWAADAASGAFLEHARVYDHGYGTPRAPVEEAVAAGRSVLLDIDAQGAAQVRHTLPEARHVMIVPPDLETLRARLLSRGTESEATVARRMALAREQLEAAPAYDYVIVNGNLAAAEAQLVGVVLAERARPARQGRVLDRLLGAADR